MVAAINDFEKQKQFSKLKDVAEQGKMIYVIRGGQKKEVHQSKIVVGDLIIIREGMDIPADGFLVKGSDVTTDESAYGLIIALKL